VSVSGAGVLASSDKQEDAQAFVNFLASVEGQQAIADSYALEYPLNPEVSLDPPVKPFSELEPPQIDVSTLNSEPVVEMMQDAGLL
jgi:iron(III) transport system substrate-binding protein